ncbi:MAG: ATP synthase F0 subunit B [Myxococcales bacterium]|nr:ATP synthase F0 subunit B [Myxococcales bacterium]
MKRFFALLQLLALLLAPALAFAAEGGGHEGGEAHGGEHHGINWYYGNIYESDEIDHPTLIARPKGMAPPVSALLLNSVLLYFILFKILGPGIKEGLKKRKQDIMKGMDDAARMKKEASASLKQYEDKLKHIDEEIDRVRREMREAAHAEREQILREAKERRERMEREAKQLVEQELKAAREELMRETVRAAVSTAGELLVKQLSSSDQQRIADEYLASLEQAVNAKGGQA